MNTFETEMEMLKRSNEQLAFNAKWLRERIDAIHDALCPGKMGTWQQRAKQAEAAAKVHADSKKDLETVLNAFWEFESGWGTEQAEIDAANRLQEAAGITSPYDADRKSAKGL